MKYKKRCQSEFIEDSGVAICAAHTLRQAQCDPRYDLG